MAQSVQHRITAGPSKWGLILNSLGDGQTVTFTAPSFANKPFDAQVSRVEREDGSNESWNISFYLTGNGRFIPAQGYYSTRDRSGVFWLA